MTDRVNEINISEHDSDLYAKRVSLVSSPTLYAMVDIAIGDTVSLKGNVTLDTGSLVGLRAAAAYVGLATVDIGTIKAWDNPNTYIGLVTAVEVPYVPATTVHGIVSAASGIVNQFPANAVKWVTVKAGAGNSTIVYIGGASTVTDAIGYPLAQAAATELKISNTNLLFLKGTDAVNELRFVGGN